MELFNRVIWTIGAFVWVFNSIMFGGILYPILAVAYTMGAAVFWMDWLDENENLHIT